MTCSWNLGSFVAHLRGLARSGVKRVKSALFGSPCAVVSKYGHNSAVCMRRIDHARGEFSVSRPLPARSGVKSGYCIKQPYGLYGLVALWPWGLTSMRTKTHLFSSRARLACVASDVMPRRDS